MKSLSLLTLCLLVACGNKKAERADAELEELARDVCIESCEASVACGTLVTDCESSCDLVLGMGCLEEGTDLWECEINAADPCFVIECGDQGQAYGECVNF
jgi:hypothetical protein